MNLNGLTIADAAQGIRKRTFSVSELVSDCLAAIKKRNKELNAYLSVFDDSAAEAKKLDALISKMDETERNTLPPLYGIPLAAKDNILIDGKRATGGSKILEHYTAPYDATAIRKLKNQGALFLGKTNLDEFAMGSSTENSAFGPSKNPHDTARVPGGSSGGSAAAVAGHLCLGALGSDTGGSIRQPASFSGIVGFKPTYGAVSRHGLMAMASSLDQIGPMTKTVKDARTLFQAIRGEDAFDATSVRTNTGARTAPVELKNLRIGIPKEYFGTGLDNDVKERVESVLAKAEAAGAILKEISLPHSQYALAAYYIIVPSEVSANLARYDGIRYGYSVADLRGQDADERGNTNDTLFDAYTKTRAKGFGAEVKRRIMLGTYTLSAGYYDAYYIKAQKVRTQIAHDFEKAFESVDIVAGPTTPTPAFPIGERTDDPLQMYLADIYTVAINLAGLPGISLPAGTVSRNGASLPAGLQLIGPRFGDDTLLAAAELFETLSP